MVGHSSSEVWWQVPGLLPPGSSCSCWRGWFGLGAQQGCSRDDGAWLGPPSPTALAPGEWSKEDEAGGRGGHSSPGAETA